MRFVPFVNLTNDILGSHGIMGSADLAMLLSGDSFLLLQLFGLKCCNVFTKMSSTEAEQIRIAVHSALVTSVKKVVGAHDFAKDAWFNYLHANAPVDAWHNTVIKDPARYSVGFLGDFLQHASTVCKDEAAIHEFTSRKVAKVERVKRTEDSFSRNDEMWVENLWIVVGEGVLHGAANLACQCREVALPSELVHHSGTAVAMLLGCISAGTLAHRLRIQLAPSFKFGCIHFEGKFSQWPSTPTQQAYLDRIDNINNCLRAWGVDARATRIALGQYIRSNLHPGLQHFVGVGVGGYGDMPCFHLDPDRFLHSLVQRGKKVLHDGLLVGELYAARTGQDNGIYTWSARRDTCVLSDVLRHYSQDSSTTLVVVLSPSGVVLHPPSSSDRREPCDIWCS